MIPFLDSSFQDFKPKRLVFDELPQNLRNRVGTSPGERREQWKARLDELDAQVRQGLTERSLEDLETRVLEDDLRQEDQREVQGLVDLVSTPGELDSAENREEFFVRVEERLSVLLTMLLQNRQFEASALGRNPQALLNELRGRTNLKIRTESGERNLLPQEVAILGLSQSVPQHRTASVVTAWNQMLPELQRNVAAMGYAQAMASAESRGETAERPAGMPRSMSELWDRVSGAVEEMSTTQKVIAGVAGAALIYGIVSWFRGNNRNAGGGLAVAALAAAGYYLHGQLEGPLRAYENLQRHLRGLSRTDFLRGYRAFRAGRHEEAIRIWGPHAERIYRHYDTDMPDIANDVEQGESGRTIEVGNEEIRMVPAREALQNYAGNMQTALFPLTNAIQNNPETRDIILLYLSATHLSAITSGLSMTASSTLAFAKLAILAPANPLSSILIISAFILAKEETEDLELPEDTEELKRYLPALMRERRDDLLDFMGDNQLGEHIDEEQVRRSSEYITGERNVIDLQPMALGLIDEAVDNSVDHLQMTQPEREALRSRVGIRNLRDQLTHIRLIQEDLSEELREETQELIVHLEELLIDVRNRNISEDELVVLIGKCEDAQVGVRREGGTLFWGYTNENGEFLDPDNLMGLGVDPGADEGDRERAAESFMVDQSSEGQVIAQAVSRTLLERGRNTLSGLIDLVVNLNGMVIVDGFRTLVVDLADNSFWEVPRGLTNWFIGSISGDEHAANVGFREFTFAYTGGLASYMVIGGRRALNPMRFMRLWREAGLRGVARPLIETAFYPATILNRGQAMLGTRLYQPLRYGTGQGRAHLGSLVREGAARGWNFMRSLNGFSQNRTAYRELNALHRALARARAAQTMGAEVAGSREAMTMIEELRGALGRVLGATDEVVTGLDNADMDHNVRIIINAIEARNQSLALRATLEELRQLIRIGQNFQPEHIARMRLLAQNDHLADQLKAFLGGLDNVNAQQADGIVRLLATEADATAAARRLHQLGLIEGTLDEALEAGRAASGLDEAADAVRAGTEGAEATADTVRAGGEAAEAVSDTTRAGGEAAEVVEDLGRAGIEGGEAVADTTRVGVEGAEVVADGARGAIGVGEVAAAESVHVAERLPSPSSLDEALEVARTGADVEMEHLARLRVAADNAETADEVIDAVKASGASQETAEAAVEALKNERVIGRLMQALDNLGVLRFGRALRGIGSVSLRGLSYAARVAGPVAGVVGVGFNGYQAYLAWEMAKEMKDNPELVELYTAKRDLFLIAGAADLTIEAGMLMRTASGAARIGAGAGFIITVGIQAMVYMAEAAIDAQIEVERTAADYETMGRRQGLQTLIHMLYNTGEDTDAREDYSSAMAIDASISADIPLIGGEENEGEQYYAYERSQTREKIFDALIRLTSPEGIPDEYLLQRKSYIAAQTYFSYNVSNFQEANYLLNKSVAFAEVMTGETRELEYSFRDGRSGTIDLDDETYAPGELSTSESILIFEAAQQENNNRLLVFLSESVENDEEAQVLMERITHIERGLDTNYLNYAMNVIHAYLSAVDSGDVMAEEADIIKWTSLFQLLGQYISFKGISFTPNPNVSATADDMIAMHQMFFNAELNALEVESLKGEYIRPSAAIAALYEVALFYGYDGPPTEEGIAGYLSPRFQSVFGVYRSNGIWKTNTRSRINADESHGRSLDEVVVAIIRRFRAEPDNILESRHDYLTDELLGEARDDEDRRREQILELANRMERVYNSYEPPDMEYQATFLAIPIETRERLHGAMGDNPEDYTPYEMRRLVLLHQISEREPLGVHTESVSFRLWAQTQSPLRARILSYFESRENNYNKAGIEDHRQMNELRADLTSMDPEAFDDLLDRGISQGQVDALREEYDDLILAIDTLIDRMASQRPHPYNNPSWVRWREITDVLGRMQLLMTNFEDHLDDIGIMDYWKPNGERDRIRERRRRRAAEKERGSLPPRIEVADDSPEVLRTKTNIDFEIDSLILMLNRAQVRNTQLEENYVNALESIRRKVHEEGTVNECMLTFRTEMEQFNTDLHRGFVGVDVVDVSVLWEGEGQYGGQAIGAVLRLIDTIIHRPITISGRQARTDLIGTIPHIDEIDIPEDRVGRAKFNLTLEINYLKRELNRVHTRNPQFEQQYLNHLNTIERDINAQNSYEECKDAFTDGLQEFYNTFIQPNHETIDEVWGERYFEVMFASLISTAGLTADVDAIASRGMTVDTTEYAPAESGLVTVEVAHRVGELYDQITAAEAELEEAREYEAELIRDANDFAANQRNRYRAGSARLGGSLEEYQEAADGQTLEVRRQEAQLQEMRIELRTLDPDHRGPEITQEEKDMLETARLENITLVGENDLHYEAGYVTYSYTDAHNRTVYTRMRPDGSDAEDITIFDAGTIESMGIPGHETFVRGTVHNFLRESQSSIDSIVDHLFDEGATRVNTAQMARAMLILHQAEVRTKTPTDIPQLMDAKWQDMVSSGRFGNTSQGLLDAFVTNPTQVATAFKELVGDQLNDYAYQVQLINTEGLIIGTEEELEAARHIPGEEGEEQEPAPEESPDDSELDDILDV